MNIYLCPNTDKKNCLEYLKNACDILVKNGCTLTADIALKNVLCDSKITFGTPEKLVSECDCVLVVGGDGTILKHAKILAGYGKAILGLNSGRLGFMATLEHDELELLDRFCEGKYFVSDRMMLNVSVNTADGKHHSYTALNDVVFTKSEGCKIADFEVSKGDTIVSSLRADGLIFSTPTGATAYSLSAGGPLIEPELECIEFTQICPHSLFARTMIFSPDSQLRVDFASNGENKVNLTADGVSVMSLSHGDHAVITRSQSTVRLIDITGNSFHNSINKKLMKPLKSD